MMNVSRKIERDKYNVSLTITRAMRGISQEKLYQELGLEPLRTRKKMFKAQLLFLQSNSNSKTIISFQINTFNLREWNELSTEIRNATSYHQF